MTYEYSEGCGTTRKRVSWIWLRVGLDPEIIRSMDYLLDMLYLTVIHNN